MDVNFGYYLFLYTYTLIYKIPKKKKFYTRMSYDNLRSDLSSQNTTFL